MSTYTALSTIGIMGGAGIIINKEWEGEKQKDIRHGKQTNFTAWNEMYSSYWRGTKR